MPSSRKARKPASHRGSFHAAAAERQSIGLFTLVPRLVGQTVGQVTVDGKHFLDVVGQVEQGRIASNAIASHFEKKGRAPSAAPEDAPEPVVMREVEYRAGLYRMVGELPLLQQRVIRMRFGEEKSIGEIARALKKTEGAVKQLQLRALRRLRSRMDEKHG